MRCGTCGDPARARAAGACLDASWDVFAAIALNAAGTLRSLGIHLAGPVRLVAAKGARYAWRMLLTGLYAGSFDPATHGHLDVVRGACRLVRRLVVAVGVHHGKTPLFTGEERVEMLREAAEPIAAEAGVQLYVTTFGGLAALAARAEGAQILVRGLRDGTDFDYEMQMAGMNADLCPDLQTVFVPSRPALRHISGTFVRQISAMGGDVTAFVPPCVAVRLRARYLAR